MSKNSFKPAITKLNIAIFLIVVMVVGFLFSRAILSMSMILFGVNALCNVHPKEWFRQKWWLWGWIWVAYFGISILWSEDKAYGWQHLQVKLPILLLPLSFAFIPAFNKKQLQLYTVILCLSLLYGIGYSGYFMLQDPARYIEGYRFSNVLPTLPKNEHIRFTLALALGTSWCWYIYPHLQSRPVKWLTGISILLFSIALHVYAVRTGLLAFYFFMSGYLVYSLFIKKTRLIAGISIAAFALASAWAFHSVPTLKNRVDHFKWSVMVFEKGEMDPNYGDIGRYISYDLAWKIIRAHPLSGVGAGDMFSEMSRYYQEYYPQISRDAYLMPHNQFLILGVAAGVPIILLFSIWLFYPLTELKRNRESFFTGITWLMVLIPILVEPVLEIQFGLFVYLFFLLMQRHQVFHGIKTEDVQHKF
ncbi:MAG TPA: O-antigen ligase family protein [Flavipsychrobacter sp.]|nr:O-antigen ligase family protein [Flavipsychrobacter sp.]